VQADAFNNAGLIYWRWAQYPQAIKALKRAIPLRRQPPTDSACAPR